VGQAHGGLTGHARAAVVAGYRQPRTTAGRSSPAPHRGSDATDLRVALETVPPSPRIAHRVPSGTGNVVGGTRTVRPVRGAHIPVIGDSWSPSGPRAGDTPRLAGSGGLETTSSGSTPPRPRSPSCPGARRSGVGAATAQRTTSRRVLPRRWAGRCGATGAGRSPAGPGVRLSASSAERLALSCPEETCNNESAKGSGGPVKAPPASRGRTGTGRGSASRCTRRTPRPGARTPGGPGRWTGSRSAAPPR
jgi:hypothetical protein